jgi:glycosyltransferase involved in cell wall biosynthesis
MGDSLAWHFVRQVDYGSACSLLVRRATWEAVAGADPQYHPAYYEDVDLCLAIRARGQQVLFEPRSRVRHHESASSDSAFKSFLFRRNQRRLQEKWASDLLFQEPAALGSTASVTRAVWRARGCPRRILVIDDRVPDPAMGSGDGRMFDALIELSSHGYALSLFPSTGARPPSDQLVSSGVAIVVDELSHHLARPEILYDAVIISRPYNFSRWSTIVRAHQPKAVLVYDCEALFWRRMARQAQLAGNTVESRAIAQEAELMRRVEEQIVLQADLAVALSRDEADILARIEGHCPIEVMLPLEPKIPFTTRSFAERRDIGFIAGWMAGSASPNADGLRWFVAEVLPRVRASLPWVRLRVTGALAPPDLRALADPNVVFEGHVADLDAFYDALRVAISPIRFGAGVKLKTVQALQYGVPIVSTAVGAEGIDAAGLTAIDVADDPESFSSLLVTLLTDAAVWNERRAAIAELVDSWGHGRPGASWNDVMARVWTRRPRGGHPLFV